MFMHFEMSLLFYWTGIVALVFQAWLTFASHSVIRRMGYEFFKATHFLAVIVFIIVFFWHCDYTLTSWHYFIATAAVYVPCFIYPWLRTAFSYGLGQKAHIHIEDNGFIRLTIPSINMRWKPGQHCFLRFTNFGLQAFSSHPFTICSLPAIEEKEKSELVFYIRHSHGLTQKLYDYTQNHPGSAVPVLVDGPYGGVNIQRFNEADRLLVVAGGSGAGWILSFLELFCRQRSAGPLNDNAIEAHEESSQVERATSSPHQYRSLRVVLATRDIASRTWFLGAVNELLARCSTTLASPDVSIEVHLTGEAERATSVPRLGVESKDIPDLEVSTKPSSSSSSSSGNIDIAHKSETQAAPSKGLSGRPDLPSLIRKEGEAAAESGSALSVYVCGPGGMLNDVRNAVARENVGIVRGGKGGSVYLHSEHFSWA
ncbi:hypothetical protein G6514_006858 [Epicoccum nigrum]|nr:hypothetical protein G6514_006858 [Epicoccum nigrum]